MLVNVTESSTDSSGLLINDTTSKPALDIPSYQLTIYICSLLFLCVFIVTGNALIIGAYRSNRRLQSGTFKLLVSLAVSDLLVGSIALPLWIYNCLSRWEGGFTGFYVLFVTLDIFSALASIYHLVIISVERYISIARPIAHRQFTRKFYNRSIAAAWVTAAIFALIYPFLVYFGLTEAEKLYSLIIFMTGFILPLIVIMIMYELIYRAVKMLSVQQTRRSTLQRRYLSGKRNRKPDENGNGDATVLVKKGNDNKVLDEQSSHVDEARELTSPVPMTIPHSTDCCSDLASEQTPGSLRRCRLSTRPGIPKTKAVSGHGVINEEKLSLNKERKTAITVGLITGLFFVCWLPFFVVSVISFYCSYCLYTHVNVAQMALFVKWMHYGNSSVNPAVYSFRNPELRRTFCRMTGIDSCTRKSPDLLPTSVAEATHRSLSRN